MIKFEHHGDFAQFSKYLQKMKRKARIDILDKYGAMGVEALRNNTPSDTGKTANSWFYKIESNRDSAVISFGNSNINNGVSIAMIIQYGHATGNGGYVEGIDYINPAIKPIFDKIVENAWREVSKI